MIQNDSKTTSTKLMIQIVCLIFPGKNVIMYDFLNVFYIFISTGSFYNYPFKYLRLKGCHKTRVTNCVVFVSNGSKISQGIILVMEPPSVKRCDPNHYIISQRDAIQGQR